MGASASPDVHFQDINRHQIPAHRMSDLVSSFDDTVGRTARRRERAGHPASRAGLPGRMASMTTPPLATGRPPLTEDAAAEVTQQLRQAVRGAVDVGRRRRAEYATDASNYRVVPQVVVEP